MSDQLTYNDVDAGIKWTNMMFSTNRLRISNKCVNLIKELQVYSYDEDASIKEGRDVVKPTDSAGAYDIDESGDLIVESYTGSYENIMGLPVEPLREWKLVV